jgi:alcohol dehydrogenase
MQEFSEQHFTLSSNSFYGARMTQRLSAMLAGQGFRNIGLIVDQGVASHAPARALVDQLTDGAVRTAKIYQSDSSAEPTYAYLDTVASEFRRGKFDALVGIGGGSALDLAKGVAVLLKNAGAGIKYRGMNQVPEPGVAVVLVPTTAGTGSEVTHTASFIDTESQTKLGINGRYMNCLFSVLDPDLLVTCPPPVTIASGLDALVHAIEGVTCRAANGVSRLLGKEGARLMLEALPKAVANPSDLEARGATLIGSHYAGLSMMNAAGGPASGISYPLGAHFRVPHGFAGGLLLPHVVDFNIGHGYWDGYAEIFDAMRISRQCAASTRAKAAEFSACLHCVYKSMDVPKTLREFGVDRQAIPKLTKLTLEQRRVNLDLNPVPFGESDVVALLEKVVD